MTCNGVIIRFPSHVREQEVLFRSVCRTDFVSNSDAGDPSREFWYSKSGASPGLLVDTGALEVRKMFPYGHRSMACRRTALK